MTTPTAETPDRYEGHLEEQFGAPRYPVSCDRCEAEWSVHVSAYMFAALSNSYGYRAVEDRFAALKADPPSLRCPVCIFRWGLAS